MRKSYAVTGVCEVVLARHEIQSMVLENLLARGGDPSYDFSRSHPIFIWTDEGTLNVRFVQGAVVAKEPDRWISLKPMSDPTELNRVLQERADKARDLHGPQK